ncbi:hypothetical protein V8G54_029216 [Vigna mungo]|uniref:Uncharacterized protein n=1 Tax=Vigna mungo TaxID=3915 RepID=A0AAQ3MU88_VIGMU
MSTACSISFSVMINGGTILTTFPFPAVNTNRPEFRQASTKGVAGTSKSIPMISPTPRISFTCGFPPNFCLSSSLKYRPFLDTDERKSGFDILSKTARAALQTRGFPAKVLP